MVALLDTFPRICLDDLDRDGAQRHVSSIHESQREVESTLRAYKVGKRLTGEEGTERLLAWCAWSVCVVCGLCVCVCAYTELCLCITVCAHTPSLSTALLVLPRSLPSSLVTLAPP